MNYTSEVALDVENEQQSLFAVGKPTPLSLDRLRILRFTNEGDVHTPWGGSILGRATLSFGMDTLGARSVADASAILPLSRQGATASFQKAEASLGYAQSLAEHITANLTLRAQTSFNQALLHAEQFGIANSGGLSAMDSGALVGDRGYVARMELISPWHISQTAVKASMTASPYVFGSVGEVAFAKPTALENGSTRGTSYGAGIRLNGAPSGSLANVSLSFEYSRSTRSDGGVAGNRMMIIAAVKF